MWTPPDLSFHAKMVGSVTSHVFFVMSFFFMTSQYVRPSTWMFGIEGKSSKCHQTCLSRKIIIVLAPHLVSKVNFIKFLML